MSTLGKLWRGVALSSLLGSIHTGNALAQEPSRCDDPTVKRIERPLYPESESSSTFDYAFEVVAVAETGFPTVILLPGGPGECAIQPGTPSNLPKGFGLIRTDPRGLCCNFSGKLLPQDSIQTRNLAFDILSIVNHLRLKKYYLYGVSYGTELATVTAGLAEQGFAPRPEGLVLEGVLGRAFHRGEVFEGFLQRWEELRSTLDPSVIAKLSELSPERSLLGLPSEEWSSAIVSMMLIGAGPVSEDFAESALSKLSDSSTEADRTLLRGIIHQFGSQNDNPKAEKQALYQEIACRELASEVFASTQDIAFSFNRGNLVPVPGILCAGIELDRPYDAAKWKTSAPIFYFEGGNDPSTPLTQARYHFGTQTRSHRTFVTVPKGGHIDLLYGLQDCSEKIWVALAAQDGSLNTALKSCALATDIQTSAASSL